MTRTRIHLVAASLLIAIAATHVHAQTAPRATRTEVTGIELGLEGTVTGVRGGSLRWILAAHEVLGVSDLRPAAGAIVRVVTSITPFDQSVSVTTDAFGRGVIDLPIPSDAPSNFMASIEVASGQRARRRFDLPIQVIDAARIDLFLVRAANVPSTSAQIFGRVFHTQTGAPLANEDVIIEVYSQRERAIGHRMRARTNAEGLFALTVQLRPDDARPSTSATARLARVPGVSAIAIFSAIDQVQRESLVVSAEPVELIVHPRTATRVRAIVRSAMGTPIARATVIADWQNDQGEPVRGETDAFGRVELPFHAPDIREPFSDRRLAVTATRAGHASGTAETMVRVSQADYATAIAVEGGHLPDALGGKLWARVVGIDGSPAPSGVTVRATGPRLPPAGLTGTTDANGVAAFDVQLLPHRDGSDDACGGIASTSVTLRVGEGARASHDEHCMSVDADATLRVRASTPLAQPGSHVRVDLERAASVRNVPIAIAYFQAASERSPLRALGALVVPANANVAEIQLPADVRGAVAVRARPLIGAERMEVRGGVTTIWVASGAPRDLATTLDAARGRATLRFETTAGVTYSGFALALPAEASGAAQASLRSGETGFELFGDSRIELASLGDAFVRARLASLTTLDTDAPSVLRAGSVVGVPAIDNPEAHGHLRDPFRARARFVGGRLALIYRAIEDLVSRAVPRAIDEVAVRTTRPWQLNERILESLDADSDLGDGGATALGGDTFDIRSLQAIDPAFTFDNVARRITRERLFTLLLNLRAHVREHELDLRWAARGEPSEWLRTAAESPSMLADGWGRPFVLRRAPSGHARFQAVEPAVGYELVSSGPNGVVGDADDMWDPTARVLPENSLYARAVGEDALVARLRGVELGRATVTAVTEAYEVDSENPSPAAVPYQGSLDRPAGDGWNAIPSRVARDSDSLLLRRVGIPGDAVGGRLVPIASGAAEISLELGSEPRSMHVLSLVAGSDGTVRVGEAHGRTTASLLVDAELPERVRAGEPAIAQLSITNVGNENVTLDARSFSDAHVRVTGTESVSIRPQAMATLSIEIAGQSVGDSSIALELASSGRVLHTIRHTLHVDRGLHPMRRRATGFAGARPFRATLSIPANSVGPQSRVVLSDGSALAEDPEFVEALEADPALLAWSRTMHSELLSDSLSVKLFRAQGSNGLVSGSSTLLSTAAAIVAWSASDTEDERAVLARNVAARSLLAQLPDLAAVNQGQEYDVDVMAAILTAVATGGAIDRMHEQPIDQDPVSALVGNLRRILRGEYRRHPENVATLAFASAALLAAQPDDLHARAMYELARAHLVDTLGGAMLPTSESDQDSRRSRAATLALALAAHSVGDDALADRLIAGALRYEAEVARAGGTGLFWLVANGAYGSFGPSSASHASVTIDGTRREVTLEHGRAVVEITDARPGSEHSVVVDRGDGGSLAARVESSYGVPFASRSGSVGVAIEGATGTQGSRSALELVVSSERAGTRLVLDVRLPTGAVVDEVFLDLLRRSPGVVAAEPREPGFLRITLLASEGATLRLPLSVRWQLAGTFSGFAVVAYPEDTPSDMTVLAPASITVGPNASAPTATLTR